MNFVSQVVDAFTIGPDDTRIGAVLFSNDVILEFALNEYSDAQSIKNRIINMRY